MQLDCNAYLLIHHISSFKITIYCVGDIRNRLNKIKEGRSLEKFYNLIICSRVLGKLQINPSILKNYFFHEQFMAQGSNFRDMACLPIGIFSFSWIDSSQFTG